MNKLFRLILFIGFFFISENLFAQETLPEKIQSYFDTYQAEFPVEKVYLQVDKSTYTLGDDLWFSAFLTAGSFQVPSPLSRTLYVDLFDGDGLLLNQRILKMEEGRGQGYFLLPPFGKPGTYRIKAYTSWMKNFGEEYFFEREIEVVDGAGGSFLPKVTFTEISRSGEEISYRVQLVAINNVGDPLVNQQVQVRTLTEESIFFDQNVVLNDQGEVNFTFKIPAKVHIGQHLELTYLENGTYPVTQKISLPYSFSLADIQFLPEGGYWLVGKKSNLAFRAIYPDGTPVGLSGELEGVSFQSNFAGLGSFEFTPEASKTYSALVRDLTTGEERMVDLPLPETKGLTLQVVNNPSASYVTVFIQGIGEPGDLLLVSQTRGIINYMIQGKLANGVWGVRIPKSNLITGINQISILDSVGVPLLERLIFFENDDQIQLNISTTGTISPRSKIALEISSQFEGQPIEASFSMAVVDAEQVSDLSMEETIFSSLLLSSDLKGKIYQPGRYFDSENPNRMRDLDLVMLTHGWSRFNWNNTISQNFPKIDYFIERGINLEGQISDQEDTRKGLAGGEVNALVGEGIEIIQSEFGTNGRFIFTEMDYLDSATITITAEDSRLKKFIDVEVIQPIPTFEEIEGSYPTEIVWPDALVSTVQERNLQRKLIVDEDFVDLEGVTVESESIQQEAEKINKIYGTGDVTIRPESIPSSVAFTNIFQLIQGRVSGVQVFVSGLDVSVQIRGVGSINSGTTPLFLLDNIPVDAGTLLQVSLKDVSSVDVFKDPARAAIFGAQGANGVIAVYTNTGAGVAYQSVGGTLVTKYGGYSIAKDFYQPMYDEDPQKKALIDKRATIFWKPIFKTDSSGQVSLEYFNTDSAKKQIIVIEGMDASGRLGRLVRVLE